MDILEKKEVLLVVVAMEVEAKVLLEKMENLEIKSKVLENITYENGHFTITGDCTITASLTNFD